MSFVYQVKALVVEHGFTMSGTGTCLKPLQPCTQHGHEGINIRFYHGLISVDESLECFSSFLREIC